MTCCCMRALAGLAATLFLAECGQASETWPLWEAFKSHFVAAAGRVVDHDAGDRTRRKASLTVCSLPLLPMTEPVWIVSLDGPNAISQRGISRPGCRHGSGRAAPMGIGVCSTRTPLRMRTYGSHTHYFKQESPGNLTATYNSASHWQIESQPKRSLRSPDLVRWYCPACAVFSQISYLHPQRQLRSPSNRLESGSAFTRGPVD